MPRKAMADSTTPAVRYNIGRGDFWHCRTREVMVIRDAGGVPDQFNSRVPSAQPHDVLPCGTGIASYEGGIRALFEENADAEVAKCHENHLGRRPPVGVETAEVYPPGGRERPMFLRKCGLFCPNASDRTFRMGGSHYARRSQGTFGMIVTGPSGSGKTTTLVASLSVINEQSRNILTVADPTEYQITGVSQTQLRARSGLTFATALRSFLRRDPDVIMVGEMGAAETALIGVHAALTGHLVPGCIQIPPRVWSRVIDRGVEGIPLASGIWGSWVSAIRRGAEGTAVGWRADQDRPLRVTLILHAVGNGRRHDLSGTVVDRG
jgi:hypothetical protein